MVHHNDGTQAHKQFRLIGGSDEDAIRIARIIRQKYGEFIAEEAQIDPAIETQAAQAGISICWAHRQQLRTVKNPWTKGKGAVASC